jgi:hypothetical protein
MLMKRAAWKHSVLIPLLKVFFAVHSASLRKHAAVTEIRIEFLGIRRTGVDSKPH